jgi:GST-like protein
MFGQANHFRKFAPEKIEYGIKRYTDEVVRLYGVMETQLAQSEYLAGEYSIADMASWPWVRGYENYGIDIAQYPHVGAWIKKIAERPATVRALQKTDEAAAAKKAAK